MIWLSVSHVSGRTGATSYNCSNSWDLTTEHGCAATCTSYAHCASSPAAERASCIGRSDHGDRGAAHRGFVRPGSPQPDRLESDPENGWLTVARSGGGRHRPGALLRGQVWRALAAVAGRDTATLKLLMVPAPRGVSISSPSLQPRGGKLPQWRPLHFESSSRISTRKQPSVQSSVAASRMRFTRAPSRHFFPVMHRICRLAVSGLKSLSRSWTKPPLWSHFSVPSPCAGRG